MKQVITKYWLQRAFFSSLAISVVGLLSRLLLVRTLHFENFYLTFILVFLTCAFDWFLLMLIYYRFPKLRERKKLRVISKLSYFLLGVLFFVGLGFIGFWISEHSLNTDLPEDYIYRRLLAGYLFALIIYLIHYSIILFEEREKVIVENERLLRENLQAKFETLRQQVNPHFLFNSLSTLKTLMRNNESEAEKYLIHLSNIFRYSLQINHAEKVILREELKILEAYLFMLKCRFRSNISFDIQIDPVHKEMQIPPFALQIIVENCVKHNIVSSEYPLWIKIYSEAGNQIRISNNLQIKLSVERSSQVGLANIEKRYQYLSGQHIEIIKNPETFEVVIPLITNK